MGQYGDTRRGRAGHLFRATEIDVMQRQPRACWSHTARTDDIRVFLDEVERRIMMN